MKTALKFSRHLADDKIIEKMLTEHETADVLNVKVSTLRAWRVKGSPLKFCRFGRSIRYSPQAIRDFLALSAYTSTTEADHAE